jgi:hypothetical protein
VVGDGVSGCGGVAGCEWGVSADSVSECECEQEGRAQRRARYCWRHSGRSLPSGTCGGGKWVEGVSGANER